MSSDKINGMSDDVIIIDDELYERFEEALLDNQIENNESLSKLLQRPDRWENNNDD